MTVGVEEKLVMREEPGTNYVDLADLDFDVTPLNETAIKDQLAAIKSSYVNKYDKQGEKDDLGLVIGRFQPPHLGHLFQILAALEVAHHVAIGIGSANSDINSPDTKDAKAVQMDRDNPFPADEREFFLKHLLSKLGDVRGENLLSRVSFVPLDDVHKGAEWHNDDEWFDHTLAKVGKLRKGRLDVTIANDGWVKNIFQGKGQRTLSIPFLKQDSGDRHEARVTRIQLRKPWGDRQAILSPQGLHRFRR